MNETAKEIWDDEKAGDIHTKYLCKDGQDFSSRSHLGGMDVVFLHS